MQHAVLQHPEGGFGDVVGVLTFVNYVISVADGPLPSSVVQIDDVVQETRVRLLPADGRLVQELVECSRRRPIHHALYDGQQALAILKKTDVLISN